MCRRLRRVERFFTAATSLPPHFCRHRLCGCLLFCIGIAAVATPGAPSLAAHGVPEIQTLAITPSEAPAAASVNGNCECDHSSGSVCCCCSHCGCGANSPRPSSRRMIEEADDNNGGNWDIDVGGLGTAGGGYCQCNGQCCCCSSCDCSSSVPSLKHANITTSGPCSGIENCNGDLPARRRHQRALSERVKAYLERKLIAHR